MQQMVKPPQAVPGNRANTQMQSIIVTAITLFALSGLMVGFAVGAFTHPHQGPTTPSNNASANTKATTKSAITPAATPSPAINVETVGLACPEINAYTYQENADSTTNYTIAATPLDQTRSKTSRNGCGDGNPLYASNLVCKIWLTNDEASLRSSKLLPALKALSTPQQQSLNVAFPGEEQGALLTNSGSESQPCSQTGPTSWTYKLSAGLKSGSYYLAILVAWNGGPIQITNWSWNLIQVQGS